MTETQRRIKAYQELLPALRERVIAVALLLAMSASMLSSASFAWLTLSRNPEVTAVNTTIASNGNLEIALATGDIYSAEAPGDSQVGDSSAAKGQSVKAANITWGNLVNLADPSYGLDKMVLRPAQLNQSALLDSPLYGATYGTDGRTQHLSSEFAYATWEPANEELGTQEGFSINNKLGVRAITSILYQADQGTAYQALQKRNAAENVNSQAGSAYRSITQNTSLMSSLATVMGAYLTASLNDGQADAIKYADVFNLSEIFRLFIEAYELQIQAMVNLANYQLFVLNSTGENPTSYTEYTVSTLMADSTKESNLYPGVKLPGLDQMKKDYKMLKENYSSDAVANDMMELVAQAKSQGSLAYSAMESIVDKLVVVGTCKVGDKTVNQLAANKSEAASLVLAGGTHKVQITNGVLYNFEKLNGTRAEIKGMSIKAKYIISVTLKADITTSAPTPHQFQTALDYGDENNGGGALTGYSQDTYGLAIDLWLRTNAADSHVTLEGNVLTEKSNVYPTITVDEAVYTVNIGGEDRQVYPVMAEDGTTVWHDAKTNQVVDLGDQTPSRSSKTQTYDLYTITITETDDGGESMSYSVDVYQKEKPDGTKVWCNATSHVEMTEEELAGQTPDRKVEVVETVIGYEGENRVWDRSENTLISADATTQGSGSCYVYYADTPEDQARSLALLEAFKVAFVDDKGELLATASMDTAHHYATTGRVIVPLKLDEDSATPLTNEATGEVKYAITDLDQNVPKRITALVYLDGTKLYNENVLAAADIQGRLNIQFGSSENMKPVQNMELSNQVRTISAELDRTSFDYDDPADNMTVTAIVKVDGDSPSTVTAFFLREINSTQGTREETITFTRNDAGEWVGSYTFPAPGKYVLRSVQLDGVEYDLPLDANGQPLRATVEGFALKSLSCREGNHLDIMTAAGTQTVNLDLEFASSDTDKMPKTVQGRYLRQDGTAVNVDFVYNSDGKWSGSATFVASGSYTMQYLILDGNYTELPSGFWLSADLTLGMRVWVDTTSPTQFTYIKDDLTPAQTDLAMQVRILDDQGEDLPPVAGAYLYYAKAGTTDLAKGMSTPLVWDVGEGCYTGTFRSETGIYSFNSVTVGANTLTNATSAPTFRILSPEPPAFNYDTTPTYRFVMGTNDAKMEVYINNCEAATVYADLVKSGVNGRTYPVEGTLSSNGTWVFPVPMLTSGNEVAVSGQEGSQDGSWTIQQIRIWDAYDANGKEYTEESPLVFRNQNYPVDGIETYYEFVTSKVVASANVELIVPEGWDASLGASETVNADKTITYTPESLFLTEHTVSGLKIRVTDFAGAPIVDEDMNPTITLNYRYGNDSSAHGGYTSTNINNTSEDRSVTFVKSASDPSVFEMNGTIKVDQAGSYTPSLTFKIGNAEVPVKESEVAKFKFAVYSKSPTVTVTGISPGTGSTHKILTDSLDSDHRLTGLNTIQGDFYHYSDYNAVVYIYCGDNWSLNVYVPSVTLTLSDAGTAFDSATITFEHQDRAESNAVYQFTTSQLSATNNIGYAENGATIGLYTWNPIVYPAGKDSVGLITMVCDNTTYEMQLSNEVTINQPQYPMSAQYTSISSIDSTYSGATPAAVYTRDGETIKVTLPTIASWTQPMSTTQNQDFVVQSGYPTTRNVYTQRTSGCDTLYTPYIETTTVSKASSTTTTWTRTKSITGWSIGGITYKPGETVILTEPQTITAVITNADGVKATESSTTTRTVIEYTQNGNESKTNPGGTRVTSVEGSSTDVVS